MSDEADTFDPFSANVWAELAEGVSERVRLTHPEGWNDFATVYRALEPFGTGDGSPISAAWLRKIAYYLDFALDGDDGISVYFDKDAYDGMNASIGSSDGRVPVGYQVTSYWTHPARRPAGDGSGYIYDMSDYPDETHDLCCIKNSSGVTSLFGPALIRSQVPLAIVPITGTAVDSDAVRSFYDACAALLRKMRWVTFPSVNRNNVRFGRGDMGGAWGRQRQSKWERDNHDGSHEEYVRNEAPGPDYATSNYGSWAGWVDTYDGYVDSSSHVTYTYSWLDTYVPHVVNFSAQVRYEVAIAYYVQKRRIFPSTPRRVYDAAWKITDANEWNVPRFYGQSGLYAVSHVRGRVWALVCKTGCTHKSPEYNLPNASSGIKPDEFYPDESYWAGWDEHTQENPAVEYVFDPCGTGLTMGWNNVASFGANSSAPKELPHVGKPETAVDDRYDWYKYWDNAPPGEPNNYTIYTETGYNTGLLAIMAGFRVELWLFEPDLETYADDGGEDENEGE